MGQQRPRILCVSLSGFQLKAMREAFPVSDYQVFTASTPEEAVAVCAGNHLAAVVLDSEFASTAGWPVAQTFRIVNAHLPVLLLANGHNGNGHHPPGVDAIATSPAEMLDRLQTLLIGSRE